MKFNSVNMEHKAAMSYGMKSKYIIGISSIVNNQPKNMAKRFQTLKYRSVWFAEMAAFVTRKL